MPKVASVVPIDIMQLNTFTIIIYYYFVILSFCPFIVANAS